VHLLLEIMENISRMEETHADQRWEVAKKMSEVKKITKDDQNAIDELAMRFFDGSGDAMAVSRSIRNVILARFEWVKKHGKDTGE